MASPRKTPDRDADETSANATEPLAVGGPEADHGRDRREDRGDVAEHLRGHRPGDTGGDGTLPDRPELERTRTFSAGAARCGCVTWPARGAGPLRRRSGSAGFEGLRAESGNDRRVHLASVDATAVLRRFSIHSTTSIHSRCPSNGLKQNWVHHPAGFRRGAGCNGALSHFSDYKLVSICW